MAVSSSENQSDKQNETNNEEEIDTANENTDSEQYDCRNNGPDPPDLLEEQQLNTWSDGEDTAVSSSENQSNKQNENNNQEENDTETKHFDSDSKQSECRNDGPDPPDLHFTNILTANVCSLFKPSRFQDLQDFTDLKNDTIAMLSETRVSPAKLRYTLNNSAWKFFASFDPSYPCASGTVILLPKYLSPHVSETDSFLGYGNSVVLRLTEEIELISIYYPHFASKPDQQSHKKLLNWIRKRLTLAMENRRHTYTVCFSCFPPLFSLK